MEGDILAMTEADRRSTRRFRTFTSIVVGILVAGTIALQLVVLFTLVGENRQSNAHLNHITTGNVLAGFESRKQTRCVAREAQATLLRILLAPRPAGSPQLTPDEMARIRALIPLPSVRVRNGDGTITVLNCDRIIREALPGLPEGIAPAGT